MMMANIADKKWKAQQGEMPIKRGSFITSLNRLSSEANLSKQIIRKALKNLEEIDFIKVKPQHGVNTVITVCNYRPYQDKHPKNTVDEDIDDGVNQEIEEVCDMLDDCVPALEDTLKNTLGTHSEHTRNTNIRSKEVKEVKESICAEENMAEAGLSSSSSSESGKPKKKKKTPERELFNYFRDVFQHKFPDVAKPAWKPNVPACMKGLLESFDNEEKARAYIGQVVANWEIYKAKIPKIESDYPTVGILWGFISSLQKLPEKEHSRENRFTGPKRKEETPDV